jgi:hypothetical protein
MLQLPPFCPNIACENHTQPEGNDWFRLFGWYHAKAHGRVKRYACQKCGKTFSDQTFHLSYYLHLNIAFKDILSRLCACSGIRAVAKYYQVTDKVIDNRIGRLARQVIGVMAGLRGPQDCCEPLVADGFESFIHSQYIHHLIGKDSQYVYAIDIAHIGRKRRLTDDQKLNPEQLEQGEVSVSGDVSASFERICHTINDLAKGSIVLHTDEKNEYRTVLEANQYLDGKLTHLTTSSREERTFRNQAGVLNYYDRELRKNLSAQVRETTRRLPEVNNCMERMYAYAGYHNFMKTFRIGQRDIRTHAEKAGYDIKGIRFYLETFFTKRFFYSKVAFNASEWLVWLRAYWTPFRLSNQYMPGYVTCRPRLMPLARAA